MHRVKRRAEKIRNVALVLKFESTPIEKELADFYNHIRLKRKKRPRGDSIAIRAEKIVKLAGGRGKISICSYVAMSLREMNKIKKTAEEHSKKCHEAEKYLSLIEPFLPTASENEAKCFKYAKKLVSVLIANQIIPGDY